MMRFQFNVQRTNSANHRRWFEVDIYVRKLPQCISRD